MYFLGVDECVYGSNDITKKLVCDVTDFEVRVDGKIIALTDPSKQADNDGVYRQDSVSMAWYTKYNIYKALTLVRDEPIFITHNNTAPQEYNFESIVSISAGIDSSIWALQFVPNATDFPLLKW